MRRSHYKFGRRSERGSVFFYILLGVVLFGTLAFVVTRSMRGKSTDAMTDRQRQLAASEIFNYAQTLEQGVSRIRRRGCSENEINFDNANLTGYVNAGSPVDQSCDVFDVNGAGVTYSAPVSDWLDSANSASSLYGEWFFTATSATDSASSAANDLLVILPFLKKEVCIALNDRIGIDNPSGAPPQDQSNGYAVTKYVGTISGSDVISSSGAELQGFQFGCFEGGGTPASGTYHFYYALIER